MNKFYGTFGGGQTFGFRSVMIRASCMNDAREAMFHTFGQKFCTVYEQDYEESEYFQKPIMEITTRRRNEHSSLEVWCSALFPENLLKFST